MNQGQKRIPNYKIKGLAGILIGIGGALFGVGLNIPVIVPIGILFGLFSIGYHMEGRIKNGIKWASIFLTFLILVVLLSYIRK